jgi:hypothetical protein
MFFKLFLLIRSVLSVLVSFVELFLVLWPDCFPFWLGEFISMMALQVDAG